MIILNVLIFEFEKKEYLFYLAENPTKLSYFLETREVAFSK